MNERKLDRCSRINTADEGTLERPVGSAAFALRIDTGKVRDILLAGFGRSPHRH
jgi:hypothetical protein